MWVSGKFLFIAIAIWVALSDIQSQLVLGLSCKECIANFAFQNGWLRPRAMSVYLVLYRLRGQGAGCGTKLSPGRYNTLVYSPQVGNPQQAQESRLP